MIYLSRSELLSLARTYVLANTPYSLFSELISDPATERLSKECTFSGLVQYYDFITARANRTEIAMGLAYAVLIALFLQLRDLKGPQDLAIDSSRLRWGPHIEEYIQLVTSETMGTIIQFPQLEVRVTEHSDTGATTEIIDKFHND